MLILRKLKSLELYMKVQKLIDNFLLVKTTYKQPVLDITDTGFEYRVLPEV